MYTNFIRTVVLLFAVAIVPGALTGCAVAPDAAAGEETDEARRKACYSSDDCRRNEYCTTQDGVCNTNCAPGQICAQVCSGFCARGPRCDYNEPGKNYVARSPAECQVVR